MQEQEEAIISAQAESTPLQEAEAQDAKTQATAQEEVNQEKAEMTKEERARRRRRLLLHDMCYIALFAAVIVVCSQLAVYVGEIPYTLQTLAVCLAAGLLGWKRGTLSVVVYILLGICGIPVFSGFKNFYALIGGASAGYVIGFIFTSLIVGITTDCLHKIGDRAKNKTVGQILELVVLALVMLAGVAVCYLFGTLWFMLIYKGSASADNLQAALTYCVYPYVWADVIKIVVAAVLVNRLKRFVK